MRVLSALLWALAWCACPLVNAIRVLPKEYREAADEVVSSITNDQQRQRRSLKRGKNVDVPFPNSADDHLVTDLPLLAEGTLSTPHWAGLLPASPDGDKFLFYWLFAPEIPEENDVDANDIPLIIWLNGGPGCSSMDGLFLENGPLRFVQKQQQDGGGGDFELVAAEHSWHKIPAYMLYIDQPVGTGLSFTTSRKYPRNDDEVNVDFYYFLQSFLRAHNDKFVSGNQQKLNRPFYFSGESHAGHYIPSMMAYILNQNDIATNSNSTYYVPLSGAAIGNGWVDPFHQYAAAEAAYGHGIIGRAQWTALTNKEKQCQDLLNKKQYSSSVCFGLLDEIVLQSFGSSSMNKVSQYDVRKVEAKRGSRTFPPGHKTVEAYLGGIGSAPNINQGTMKSVLKAIHATPSRDAGQVYEECTNPPYDALSHQDGLGVVPEVVQVLEYTPQDEGEDKVRLLFFNGVEDLICNHVGNEVMLEKLPWKNQEAYVNAPRAAWMSRLGNRDNISGYIKQHDNLLYLKIMDAGHMVPMDLPDVALDMMRTFVFGGPNGFHYSPQKLNTATAVNEQCVCPSNIEILERLNEEKKKKQEGQDGDDENGRHLRQ